MDDYAVNLDAFDNISAYLGAAEEILPHLELQPTMVIVDPPRPDWLSQPWSALVRMAAPQILYVSCNDPAQLARDVKRLAAAGYTLEAIRPFDLFLQAYHVESISLLARVKAKRLEDILLAVVTLILQQFLPEPGIRCLERMGSGMGTPQPSRSTSSLG